MDERKNYGTSDQPLTKAELDAQPKAAPAGTFEGHRLPKSAPPQWAGALDERTNKHIAFAREYARIFAHGAPGHLDLMTIAALAGLLDNYEDHGNPWPQIG